MLVQEVLVPSQTHSWTPTVTHGGGQGPPPGVSTPHPTYWEHRQGNPKRLSGTVGEMGGLYHLCFLRGFFNVCLAYSFNGFSVS